MSIKELWTLRFVAIVFFGFIIGNLIFLDFIILQERRVNTRELSTSSLDGETQDAVDIQESLSDSENVTLSDTASGSSEEQNVANTMLPASEYFISFGGGVVRSTEWKDVPGAAAYIDGSRYDEENRVLFEAGVYIPTGNQTAYVRLFNKTAEHPVWFSDVSLDGGDPQLLVSEPITLDPGNNLYQVQIKSSLLYDVNLTDARVRIQTN